MKRRLSLLSAIFLLATAPAYPGTRYDADSGRISLNYTDTEIAQIFVDVAASYQVDLVIFGACDKRVSLTMDNVEFGTFAFQLRASGDHSIESGGKVIRAFPKEWQVDSDNIYYSDLLAKRPALPDEYVFSVEFVNEPLRTHLRNIADLCELNLVIPLEFPSESVATIRFCETTWRAAFRELLLPVGYTFMEDQNIVRLIPIRCPGPFEDPRERAPDRGAFSKLALLTRAPVAVPLVLASIVHLALAIGAARKPLIGRALFAPKWVWIGTIAVGGVLPLLAYWAMHYSTFSVTIPEGKR